MSASRNHPRSLCVVAILVSLGGCLADNQASTSNKGGPLPTSYSGEQCPSAHPTQNDIPEGLDKTPRDNWEAEQLAFEAACAITAPNALYDRVVIELSAIRAAYPETRDLHAKSLSNWGSNQLVVEIDGGLGNGDLTEFNNLNLRYGAQVSRPLASVPGYIVLTYTGRYNLPVLAKQYRTLPYVTFVGENQPSFTSNARNVPDIPDVCLAIDTDNSFDYYLFVTGRTLQYSYRTDAVGNISVLDPKILVATTPKPTWYQNCTQWLD